uniref:Transmembrane protein n=1 Tax=Heterorhabditis bacteriophora TaxID=37862 RepID=A0A1I7WFE0_HETBA
MARLRYGAPSIGEATFGSVDEIILHIIISVVSTPVHRGERETGELRAGRTRLVALMTATTRQRLAHLSGSPVRVRTMGRFLDVLFLSNFNSLILWYFRRTCFPHICGFVNCLPVRICACLVLVVLVCLPRGTSQSQTWVIKPLYIHITIINQQVTMVRVICSIERCGGFYMVGFVVFRPTLSSRFSEITYSEIILMICII